MAAAEATGDRVEVVSARTETEQVFANPDGSFTMELSLGPERVRKGNGWSDPTMAWSSPVAGQHLSRVCPKGTDRWR